MLKWNAEVRLVADLHDWEHNPRKITEDDFYNLKQAILQRGFHDVIKIDVDGTILSGHQRKRVLAELGITEVNVLVPERRLSEEERKEVAIESNVHRGSFDFDLLANNFDSTMLLDMGMSKFDLGLAGSEEETPKRRRIIFSIDAEQYEETLMRIDNARNKLGCQDKTDLLLELLSGVET